MGEEEKKPIKISDWFSSCKMMGLAAEDIFVFFE